MLSQLIDDRFIGFNLPANDWKQAIRMAAQPLIDYNKCEPEYVEEMIHSAEEYGQYIVITKHVALPHARSELGALDSALSIATLQNPIEFGNEANDPVKYLFCLCAKDDSLHLQLIAALAELLDNEDFYKALDAEDKDSVLSMICGIEKGE